MSDKHIDVTNHLLNKTDRYQVNDYYRILIHMVGEEKAKKIMMEATVYKKKSFECPRNHQIYTINISDQK